MKNSVPKVRSKWVGFTHDTVGRAECPYMRRWIFWMGPLGTLRLHHFMRSDMDEALHDHPWRFVTFPFSTYDEYVPVSDFVDATHLKEVKRWRFHYRPANYRHAVKLRKPTWTLVWTGRKMREWGFWREGVFTKWKAWFTKYGLPPCNDPEFKPGTRLAKRNVSSAA